MVVVPEMNINTSIYENVVTEVKWILTASRGDAVVDTNGSVTLPKPSIPFKDFESLTKDQVISWVKEILGEEEVQSRKDTLEGSLDKIINPQVVHKLPQSWTQNL